MTPSWAFTRSSSHLMLPHTELLCCPHREHLICPSPSLRIPPGTEDLVASSWPKHGKTEVLNIQACSYSSCRNLCQNVCVRQARRLGRKRRLLCKPGDLSSILRSQFKVDRENWAQRPQSWPPISTAALWHTCTHVGTHMHTHIHAIKGESICWTRNTPLRWSW